MNLSGYWLNCASIHVQLILQSIKYQLMDRTSTDLNISQKCDGLFDGSPWGSKNKLPLAIIDEIVGKLNSWPRQGLSVIGVLFR
jgi:hypothetical protein